VTPFDWVPVTYISVTNSNYGTIRYRFRDNRRHLSDAPIFPIASVFNAPLTGVTIGTSVTKIMSLYVAKKFDDKCNNCLDTIPQYDGSADLNVIATTCVSCTDASNNLITPLDGLRIQKYSLLVVC